MMRKILLIGLLPVVLVAVFLMQDANALIPRMDFSDNHYTYISQGGPKICGDHLCKPGEWDHWKKQLMLSQLKKSGTIINKPPTTTSTTKPFTYGDDLITNNMTAKITRVDTINMGNGDYVSFITVASDATPIHRIGITQTNADANVKKAWINPLWSVQVNSNSMVFDSSKVYLLPDDSVGIVVVTDDKTPTFSLKSVA